MQVIEIEDSLAVKINEAAQSENKSLKEFIDSSLREVIKRIERRYARKRSNSCCIVFIFSRILRIISTPARLTPKSLVRDKITSRRSRSESS
jgi:hypothetical protein